MFWSFTVTLACRALPTLTVFDGTLIATVPTGTTLTLMTADEVIPSIVARIVAVPGASPTTNPPEDTAATAVAVGVIILVSSVFSIYKVLVLEPAIVFRS